MEVVYGTRVSPFTGQEEIKKGRIVIFQDEFSELDEKITKKDITLRIFSPENELNKILSSNKNLELDPDFDTPCIIIKGGNTFEAMDLLNSVFLDLEYLNSDDDQVFAERL
jgi:hypothetical protein